MSILTAVPANIFHLLINLLIPAPTNIWAHTARSIHPSIHPCGHLLEVLITRSDVTTRSVYVDQPMSDHSTITAEVNLAVRQRVRRIKRCCRTFDAEEFIQDIEGSSLVQHPPSKVDELFALYDKTLRPVLDELHSKHPTFAQFLHLPVGTTLSVAYRNDLDASPRKNPPTDEDR